MYICVLKCKIIKSINLKLVYKHVLIIFNISFLCCFTVHMVTDVMKLWRLTVIIEVGYIIMEVNFT